METRVVPFIIIPSDPRWVYPWSPVLGSVALEVVPSKGVLGPQWASNYHWLLCTLSFLNPGLIRQKWVTISSQVTDPDRQDSYYRMEEEKNACQSWVIQVGISRYSLAKRWLWLDEWSNLWREKRMVIRIWDHEELSFGLYTDNPLRPVEVIHEDERFRMVSGRNTSSGPTINYSCEDMDGSRIFNTSVSQKEENEYCVLMHTCGV